MDLLKEKKPHIGNLSKLSNHNYSFDNEDDTRSISNDYEQKLGIREKPTTN